MNFRLLYFNQSLFFHPPSFCLAKSYSFSSIYPNPTYFFSFCAYLLYQSSLLQVLYNFYFMFIYYIFFIVFKHFVSFYFPYLLKIEVVLKKYNMIVFVLSIHFVLYIITRKRFWYKTTLLLLESDLFFLWLFLRFSFWFS